MSERPGLKREIGLMTAVAMVVGSAIGSGIFKKPALMAHQLGSPSWLIAVWIIAGLLTLFGSLSVAEVAALFPETGGQYYFFKRIYGNFFAYLFGWAVFAVIQTGSIASIAFIFAETLGHFLNLPRFSPAVESSWVIHMPFIGNITPLVDIGTKMAALVLIGFLTLINYVGVVLGGTVQSVITVFKVLALAGLACIAFFGHGSLSHFSQSLSTLPTSARGLFAAFIAALSGAFWAYDGWINVTYVAGEVKSPQKNLPRSLWLGTWIVIGVYVAINLAFIYALPLTSLAQSKLPAADAAAATLGPLGERLVLAAILISTFGACNGSLLAGARVYFAMAREGVFFSTVGKVQERFLTPGRSLILQAVWTAVLVMSGTFDTLTDMLIFVTWIFYGAACAGVFVLRKKMPLAHRPYKVWGYPWVPAFFILFAFIFVVETLIHDVSLYTAGQAPLINSVFGLFLTALGIPLFYYFTAMT